MTELIIGSVTCFSKISSLFLSSEASVIYADT
jgi:hypothetical protein